MYSIYKCVYYSCVNILLYKVMIYIYIYCKYIYMLYIYICIYPFRLLFHEPQIVIGISNHFRGWLLEGKSLVCTSRTMGCHPYLMQSDGIHFRSQPLKVQLSKGCCSNWSTSEIGSSKTYTVYPLNISRFSRKLQAHRPIVNFPQPYPTQGLDFLGHRVLHCKALI